MKYRQMSKSMLPYTEEREELFYGRLLYRKQIARKLFSVLFR